jgi:hypothetical protein
LFSREPKNKGIADVKKLLRHYMVRQLKITFREKTKRPIQLVKSGRFFSGLVGRAIALKSNKKTRCTYHRTTGLYSYKEPIKPPFF